MSNERTGRCMCGAVTYSASGVSSEATVCHCDMCRRWSSGMLFAVSCEGVSFEDESALGVVDSSAWAQRGFCTKCGTGLFYRITAEGPMKGVTSVTLGTLDDPTGLTLVKEWFSDKRPDVYELAGDRECVTEAQVLAMFGGG